MNEIADEPSSLLDWATRLAVDPDLRTRFASEPRDVLDEQGLGEIPPVDLHHALPLVTDSVAARLGTDVDLAAWATSEAQRDDEDAVDAVARQLGQVTDTVLAHTGEDGVGEDLDDEPDELHDPTADLDDLGAPDDLDDPMADLDDIELETDGADGLLVLDTVPADVPDPDFRAPEAVLAAVPAAGRRSEQSDDPHDPNDLDTPPAVGDLPAEDVPAHDVLPVEHAPTDRDTSDVDLDVQP